MPSHGLMVIFCNRRSGQYVITHAEFTILLPLCHHFSVAVCMLSACTKMEFAQALRHLKGKDLLDVLWSLWTTAGCEPPGKCLNWCEMSVMLILSKGLWGSNTTFISKEMFHFKRCLKSVIIWKWLCSFIRRLQKDEFVRQLFILHSLHFNIVLRPVLKMYFLLLTLSSSITVTTWWEELTFLGWYKGSKIIRSKNLWQCSSLIMSPASPFYHDYIYMSSLVYGSLVIIGLLTFVNTKYLNIANSPLDSNPRGCAADHLSGHDWIDTHPQEKRNATNCNKYRTQEVFSLSLSLFPVSLPVLNFL